MVDYMKSQLKAIFELRYINLNRSIEKIATLVEAYSVMLIVVLCSYILFVVLSSSNVMSLTVRSVRLHFTYDFLLNSIYHYALSGPCIFILMAHNLQKSAFPDLKDLYKKALMFVIPAFAVIGAFAVASFIIESS